jgi:hypothetical protein
MRRRFLLSISTLVFVAHFSAVRGDWFGRTLFGSAIADTENKKPLARTSASRSRYVKKIDLVYRPLQDEHRKTALNQHTPTPQGWDSYDGSVYTPERGYGWLTNLRGKGRDRGIRGIVVLTDGTRTSPEKLRRPELANFQGRHGENRPMVFRMDLPDG